MHLLRLHKKGGDDVHPGNDRLWDDNNVRTLLSIFPRPTAKEQKEIKRQKRNARYQAKRKDNYLKLLSSSAGANEGKWLFFLLNTDLIYHKMKNLYSL